MEYTAPPAVDNAVINVKPVDCTACGLLKEGDVIEGGREVEVSVKPKNGYYIEGKDVTNYAYIKTMKYCDYESNIKAVVRTHKVKKLYSITLDNTDSHGTVIYKLNGDEVAGTVMVREEDKLTIEYELTDDNYKIVRGSDGFWGGINDWGKNTFSKNTETQSIELSDKINGATIKRSDYIDISEKVGEE